jgi:hypothetical protein
MTDEQRTGIFLRIAWSYLGTPYTWGGDNPDSVDCSGLVIACGKAVGYFPRKFDTTADGLWRDCLAKRPEEVRPGDLVFWQNRSERMTHVGILIDPTPELYIGAEGGGSWATNPMVAMARNAFVKVRPVRSRGSDSTRRYGRLKERT